MSTSSSTKLRLAAHEYTVGWISALPIEQAAAAEMLDEEHEHPPLQSHDSTLYTLGRICSHNVVIACLPAGVIGIASAASVAVSLTDRFLNANIGLMVGIAGGVPTGNVDIRLGDVVVSQPGHSHGGVVKYDMGKRLPNGKF
jgi:nucleoside phosphorylase